MQTMLIINLLTLFCSKPISQEIAEEISKTNLLLDRRLVRRFRRIARSYF